MAFLLIYLVHWKGSETDLMKAVHLLKTGLKAGKVALGESLSHQASTCGAHGLILHLEASDTDLGLLVLGKTADLCNHIRQDTSSLPKEIEATFRRLDTENSVLRISLVCIVASVEDCTFTVC